MTDQLDPIQQPNINPTPSQPAEQPVPINTPSSQPLTMPPVDPMPVPGVTASITPATPPSTPIPVTTPTPTPAQDIPINTSTPASEPNTLASTTSPAPLENSTQENSGEPAELQKLTEELMKDLGLEAIEPGQKEDLMNSIRDRVNDTILLTLLENLSPEDAEALEAKLKAGATDEEALEFLAGQSSQYADKFAQALANLYKEIKDATTS